MSFFQDLPDLPGTPRRETRMGLSREPTEESPGGMGRPKRKRRLSSSSSVMMSPSSERIISIPDPELARSLDFSGTPEDRMIRRPRLLSQASSPRIPRSPTTAYPTPPASAAPSLLRSASGSDIRSMSPMVPQFPKASAKTNLKIDKAIVDFTVSAEEACLDSWPVGWSYNNVLVFGRGNRVHYKNLATNEDIGQLCKLKDDAGNLKWVDCGGKDQPDLVAIATDKGAIQVWDLLTKKMTTSWHSKGMTCMKWNGPILSVASERGAIRHYDTRIKPTAKLKEMAKRVTRHEAKICSLSWNVDGLLLASGDEAGIAHCWDSRKSVSPLEVGEVIQRRKKMQHHGPVRALAWSPWQTKLLATGDCAENQTGTIRVWNVNPSSGSSFSDLAHKMELDAPVTSLHWSPHCKEIVSTHAVGAATPVQVDFGYFGPPMSVMMEPEPSKYTTSVAVHQYPSFREVVTVSAGTKVVSGSLLSPNGQKMVIAVPEEGKLRVWDVWGKLAPLKREPSLLDAATMRIR